MAEKDSEIKIGIRTDGTKQSAKDIREVSDALESTGKSADDLVQESMDRLEKRFEDLDSGLDDLETGFEAGAGAVDGAGESMEETGKKAGGLMGGLKGVGGSMFAAFSAADLLDLAVGAVASSISRVIAQQDEMLSRAAQLGPEIQRSQLATTEALAAVPSAVSEAITALESYYDAVDAQSGLAQQQAQDAQALATARKLEAEALIELREARGEIDGEAAREERRKLAIEGRIEQHERELEVLKLIEEQELKKAEAAERVLEAAKKAEAAAKAEEEAFVAARGDKERVEEIDPELVRKREQAFKDRERIRRQLDEANTFAGGMEIGNAAIETERENSSFLDGITTGAAAIRFIKAHTAMRDERAALAAELERLTTEAERLDAEFEKVRNERYQRVTDAAAARTAEREAAQEAAAAAGVNASTASGNVVSKEGVDREIVDTQNSADETRGEAEKLRAEEARKAAERRAAEAAANDQAKSLVADIDQSLASANASADPQLVADLASIRDRVADGFDNNELAQLTREAISILGSLSSDQTAAKGIVEGVKRDLENLRSQVRNSK